MSRKLCRTCGETKEVAEFYPRRSRGQGSVRADCKECCRASQRARRERMRAEGTYASYYRDSHLRSKFNISLEQYEEMLNRQNGVCRICGRPERRRGQSLGVDHDHACCPGTKTCGSCIRGLLCHDCNSAIGLLGEDMSRIQSVVEYLQGARI